jgi:hypothetical protein
MSGGALEASVTLEDVLNVVSAKRVPLAPELAGYLVLEIAEHADPNGGAVDPKSVFVGEEGTVALVRPKRENTHGDAEASIRISLGRLLEASGSQTPALAATSKRKNGAGLPALVDEIESALIPVNRAAGRRALARLAREVKRVTLGVGRHTLPSSSSLRPNSDNTPGSSQRPSLSRFSSDEDPTAARSRVQFAPEARAPSFSRVDVDALIDQFGVSGDQESHARALKAMAGVDPTPPPKAARGGRPDPAGRAGAEPPESDVDVLLAMNNDWPTDVQPARPATGVGTGRALRGLETRRLPTQPSQLRPRATLPSASVAFPGRRWGALALVAAIAALVAGGYALWRVRQNSLSPRAQPTEPNSIPAPSEAAATCLGTLLITEVPLRSEVLVHEGQAPVDVTRMPVGARLEFVATAEGYTPKRVVVPAGVAWDTGSDGNPRFEAAVQLDPTRTHGVGDIWPAGEPGSAVGGEGPPGTVRVVATPRGAEIWMLAGIGPEARIDHLRCDREIDVLVAGPTTFRKRLHVAPSDFVADNPSRPQLQTSMTRVARIVVTGR